VAALTEQARAVRADAERLRLRSLELRTRARRQLGIARRTRGTTAAGSLAFAGSGARSFASAWSSLLWRTPDAELRTVLTALD
jgi:hypothetical protein